MSETFIVRSSAIAARMLAGEMMVMNSADSKFFTLNEVATAIWQAADGRTPLSRIVRDGICEKFDVELEQAQADAERFVTELASHGILLVSDQPFTDLPATDRPISDPPLTDPPLTDPSRTQEPVR
ncbi:MAG: PqqD family protein [Terriglobales bacterium]